MDESSHLCNNRTALYREMDEMKGALCSESTVSWDEAR